MPLAINPQDGKAVYLTDQGSWEPAQTAVNPQTKETMAFDGKAWSALPMPSVGKYYEANPYGAGQELAHSFTMGLARPTHGAVEALGATINKIAGRANEGIGEAFNRGEQEYDTARSMYERQNPGTSLAASLAGAAGTL